jgi:8-oxo-dGTP pyrophosphatase MutT (NUDIX family)
MLNALWRSVYRIGYLGARATWRLRHPSHRGAVVAIWHTGRILVVQQSYRSMPCWPGGGISPGEEPVEAARRELQEELGLVTSRESLVLAREIEVDWEHRRDHVHIFELTLPALPDLRIDHREIIAADFVSPLDLLQRTDIPPYIAIYLRDWMSQQ